MTERSPNTNWRVLNTDGSLNIRRSVSPRAGGSQTKDLYHYLLSISSRRFFGIIFCWYLFINLIFACLYSITGPDALEGVRNNSSIIHFLDCFFFSVQTVATIGYGRISPISVLANILVTFEAFLGMLSLALVTGLFYARFSKPTARVIFSKNALITRHNGHLVFMFRVANGRLNQIVEANMGVTLVINEKTLEGHNFRRLYDLKLQRSHSPMFALSWTVIHIIDDHSPLNGLKNEDFIQRQAEFIVALSGIDETMSQTIHSRCSYTFHEILFARHYKDMITRDEEGHIKIDLKAIDDLL